MKRFISHLIVALIAFLFGSVAARLFSYTQSPASEANVIAVGMPAMPPPALSRVKEEPRNLSPEESEVVSEAESFMCQNGYTERQCGTAGRIFFEPGENSDHFAAIWARRHGTLEAKAYGLVRKGRGRITLWTVVFRYTERAGKDRQRVGRAWVVDNRGCLVSFHRDYPLAEVTKRL